MKQRIMKATPLISLTLFLGAGLFWEDWLLGLSFFLLVPISWILYSSKPLKRLNDIMMLLALLVFIWLGAGFGWWEYAWVVFLLVPIVSMISEKRVTPRRIVTMVIIGLFVMLGFLTEEWDKVWIVLFLIPITNMIFFPRNTRRSVFDHGSLREKMSRFIVIDDDDDDF